MRGRSERGAVLMMAVIAALIAAVMSYGILALAMAQAKQSVVYRNRTPAINAAEAALVWAREQLWQNPLGDLPTDFCFQNNPDVQIDHDQNPATPPINVDIIVTGPCPSAALQLSAKAAY